MANSKNRSTNKKILIGLAVIVGLFIVIGVASGGSKSSNKSSTANNTSKATFQATLYNIANNDNTPMTLPAAGWDANDGWDTAAQAALDSSSTTSVQPAVVVKDAHTLELNINVHNTGKTAGTAECTIKASSSTGSNFSAGQYYGVNNKTVTALNGGDIQPDQYGNVVDDLTITGQGAQFIKQVIINC